MNYNRTNSRFNFPSSSLPKSFSGPTSGFRFQARRGHHEGSDRLQRNDGLAHDSIQGEVQQFQGLDPSTGILDDGPPLDDYGTQPFRLNENGQY